MYYNHQLRSNLQEGRNRFLKSDFSDAKNNFVYLFEDLHNELQILNIVNDLITTIPYTKEQIEVVFKNRLYRHKFNSRKDHISFIYHFCKWIIDDDMDFRYLNVLSSNPKDAFETFKDSFIIPLIDFIHDQLDQVNYILYILEKYKLRTEWFTKQELYQRYSTIKSNFEELLEEDLRLFLFDQGVDYPFSTPKSASGRADVISLIDTDDPLVLEIKIWDSKKGYKKDRVISGFAQIVKYANDYHKDTGYIVVFNMDNIEIEIQGKENDNKWPNRFIFNSKTYYIIIINMNYDTSASKQGILKKESIAFEELTKDILL